MVMKRVEREQKMPYPTLQIQSPKLRMVSWNLNTLAFWRWLYSPIIIWQGDWIPRAKNPNSSWSNRMKGSNFDVWNRIRGVGPCSSCDIPGCLGVKSKPSWNQWWSKKSVWFQKKRSQSQSHVIRGNNLENLWQMKQNYHKWKGRKQNCDLHNCIRTVSWFSHYKHSLPLHPSTRTITATKPPPPLKKRKKKTSVRFNGKKLPGYKHFHLLLLGHQMEVTFHPWKGHLTTIPLEPACLDFNAVLFLKGKKVPY